MFFNSVVKVFSIDLLSLSDVDMTLSSALSKIMHFLTSSAISLITIVNRSLVIVAQINWSGKMQSAAC